VAGRSARGARLAGRRARSQHFLRSPRLAAAIVAEAAVRPGELVLDVGAGGGRLTEPLAARGARVHAIEVDPAWAAHLRERFRAVPNVTVVEADALRARLPDEPFRVLANLPFHLTTPILRRLLDDPAVPLARADVLVEWEVARKRALCWPSTLLSVLWGASYELVVVRRIPAACFEPRPAADAGVLRVVRRAEPLVPPPEIARFRALVEAGFRTRRPSLRAALAPVVPERAFKRVARELGFDAAAAARDLDAHQWAALFAVAQPAVPSDRGSSVLRRHEPL
jgi:23S rRNA (adenine-N6)-dimethyltransferase